MEDIIKKLENNILKVNNTQYKFNKKYVKI